MSGFSLRGAIDAKCRDCGGLDGGARFWRLHVSACPVTHCPLWRVRPLTGENPPAWLSSRDPARLPAAWRTLSQGQAVALIRGVETLIPTETGRNNEADGKSEGEARRC